MAKLLFPAFLLVASLLPVMAQDAEAYSGTVMAEEGAWCWFADPRALHYENEAGTINASYIGYIDVHGNVKATQYDWLTIRAIRMSRRFGTASRRNLATSPLWGMRSI